ncbi:hypothetical protein SteCoe_17642 [Stentor coeruleus]|uniref:Uncharacterized protein n=1 Tax=Stentor coeruleus TaxID=5963 RepID=A0A1R2BYG0_9CILI|nr:hypothetical protein SteCoe_17642 [Stentor coeruleus]
MNSPDLEYEQTLASPSERNNNVEVRITEQLQLLKEQVKNVNDKLQINMKILNEKQTENKHLKELLSKLEVSMGYTGNTQATEVTVSSEGVCTSCKSCVLS